MGLVNRYLKLNESVLLEYNRSDFKKWAQDDSLVQRFMDNRNKFQAPENDMGYWVNPKNGKSPKDLKDFMDKYVSKSAKKKEEMAGGTTIYDDGRWKCIHVTTYDAMKHYGKGTKWCIAGNYPGHEGRGQYYFDSYLESNYSGYYVLTDKEAEAGDNKWCICVHKDNPNEVDVWNAPDNNIRLVPGNPPKIKGLPPLGAITVEDGVLVSVKSGRYSDAIGTLIVPKDVTSIAPKAVYKVEGVRKIKFEDPSSCTEIGKGAFARTSVEGLFFPESVTKIGSSMCLSCDYLKVAHLSKNITDVPPRAFAYANDSLFIEMPGKMKSIDDSAFEGVRDLTITANDDDEVVIDFVKKFGCDMYSITNGNALYKKGKEVSDQGETN